MANPVSLPQLDYKFISAWFMATPLVRKCGIGLKREVLFEAPIQLSDHGNTHLAATHTVLSTRSDSLAMPRACGVYNYASRVFSSTNHVAVSFASAPGARHSACRGPRGGFCLSKTVRDNGERTAIWNSLRRQAPRPPIALGLSRPDAASPLELASGPQRGQKGACFARCHTA